MKKLFIAACIYLLACHANAQSNYADSLKTLLSKTSEPIKRFDILNNILLFIQNNQAGNIDSASYIELFKIAQELKSDSLLAISYNWIGSYFSFTKGDNVSALEYLFKAIPLAEKTNDKRRISSLYFDISLAYAGLQNYDEVFKNTIKGGQNLPDKSSPIYFFMLGQYHRNLCRYYLETRQPDSALHYALLFTESSNKAKKSNLQFNALIYNGTAYALNGDTELAALYFKRAKNNADSVRINALLSSYYSHYIKFLLDNNDVIEAKNLSAQLLNLGQVNNNNTLKLAGAGFMRQVFDSLHHSDSAYYYSRMEAKINAEIFSQNNLNKMQSLAFNEQIRNIEKQAKELEEEQQRKQNIQYALMALGIITFIIAFLLLSRRHITNTKVIQFLGVVALLVVFEFLNLLLHPFLERITHHSPVLMLMALVCIAALLVPLHHKLEHWATHKMIEKNKAVRLAAAKKTIEQLEK